MIRSVMFPSWKLRFISQDVSYLFLLLCRLNEFPKHISGEGCEFKHKSDVFQWFSNVFVDPLFIELDTNTEDFPPLPQPSLRRFEPSSSTSLSSCFAMWCRHTALRSVYGHDMLTVRDTILWMWILQNTCMFSQCLATRCPEKEAYYLTCSATSLLDEQNIVVWWDVCHVGPLLPLSRWFCRTRVLQGRRLSLKHGCRRVCPKRERLWTQTTPASDPSLAKWRAWWPCWTTPRRWS